MRAADEVRRRRMAAGLDAFERGAFFEAHERWEDVWRIASAPERVWVQGLIQLAAALLKMELAAWVPCHRLASRAAAKLADGPDELDGVNLLRAREVASALIEAARAGSALPSAARHLR